MEQKHIALASASVLVVGLLGYYMFARKAAATKQKVVPKEDDNSGEKKE
tara:strand:- start:153 stop:299 length:147 start_codon:yes stop_codon:yes gene_type:complete